jgi:hypothetical protein
MSEHAETAARDALSAVIADTPQDARHIINALSFRDRALLLAWAGHIGKIQPLREIHRGFSAWPGWCRGMQSM